MEKLSLYDLLSFILPGAIATILLNQWLELGGHIILNEKLEEQFSVGIFISASFFLGSLIHYACETKIVEKFLIFCGIKISIEGVFKKLSDNTEHPIVKFYAQKLDSYKKIGYKNLPSQIEELWSEIFYYLEANEKIETPKSFQSFYFFFRNMFFLSLVALLTIGYMQLFHKFSFQPIHFWVPFASAIISVLAGRMHRTKMIERMFWTYFSLDKKTTHDNEKS